MNKLSLAYTNVKNQHESSWMDDPFELKGVIAGVANMNHQRNLNDFAEQLVANYAKYIWDHYELCIDMLPEYEQNELVRLHLENTGRELIECVNGKDFSIENDYTCALLSMLQNDCFQTRQAFAEVTRKNILIYYKESLDAIIDTACDNYMHSINNENGLYALQDREHGELKWRKY